MPEDTFFLDVAFPELKVALEIDGWEFHGKVKADFERTWRRHNALVAAGWCVLHITWQQLTEEPKWVIAKIRMLVETRNPGCRWVRSLAAERERGLPGASTSWISG